MRELVTAEDKAKVGFEFDELPLQHILLFLPWIQNELSKENILHLYESFGMTDEQRDELIITIAKKDGDEHIKDIFNAYYRLFCDDLKIARQIAKWFYRESQNQMAKRILFDNMDSGAFEVYKKEFIENSENPDVLPKLAANLAIVEIADSLKTHVSDQAYKEIAQNAKEKYQKNSLEAMWFARCEFLINFITIKPISRKPENWLNEFIVACSYTPRTSAYAFYIDKNYKTRIEEYRIKLAAESAAPAQFTSDLVSSDAEEPKTPRAQDEFGKKPSNVKPEIISSNYSLYKYQEELAGQAKEGKNCIICAPTGSGKTLIAVEIIADHLRKKKVMKQVGRVVFFVPTIPLVDQQCNYIKEKIGTECFVTKMSGDERAKTSHDRLIDIMVGDIIVMTPQIFINMWQSPLKSQKIYLSDFTLMIFDECHHCNESHPYNIVMENVRNAEIRPQIIGLTASTGSGKSKGGKINHEDTFNHIIALCARLMAVTICSVKDKQNIEDMKSRISQPVDDFIAVHPALQDKFAHEIALICDFIERNMEAELKNLQKVILSLGHDQINFPKEEDLTNHRGGVQNGSSKTNIAYYSKLTWIKSEVEKKVLPEFKEQRLYVLKCLGLLNMLYYALKYNELFPAKLAMNYLEIRLEEFEAEHLFFGKENNCVLNQEKLDNLRELCGNVKDKVIKAKKYMEESENKPILTELIRILTSQDSDSRIIIFVDMRKVGSDLSKYLNNREEIIEKYGKNKVGYIASSNQASSKFGQTQSDQQLMLQKFKDGKINILVATSVAEEGLDVAACNLIIKYNSVGSEKQLTQRKGRARAKDSKAILLALEEKTMRREFENIRKEFLMNICIQALQAMSEYELTRRIKEKFEEQKKIMAFEKERRELNHLRTDIYELCCKECSRVFCKSDEIFSLNNNDYVCCNRDCWFETSIKRKAGQKEKGQNVTVQCGDWLCQCGYKRGTVIKYGGTFLPTISSASFFLKLLNGKHESFQTKDTSWKSIKESKFYIYQITVKELREMAASLFNYNHEMYKNAEENGSFAVLEFLKHDKKLYPKNHCFED